MTSYAYGRHIHSMEAPTTAAAMYTAPGPGPVLVTAVTVYNGDTSNANDVSLYFTDGSTFDATTLIYKAEVASEEFSRFWFADAALLLMPGETIGVSGQRADVHVHLFGITDLRNKIAA